MASKASINKKNETVINDDTFKNSARRVHKHTLEMDSQPDTANVGSSRRRRVSSTSGDTIGRSTSPADVNRTRTGRVSKAAKGQPVHHCHCGKTYTRAEHLRRHQQNHKPGAFPCDVQGCQSAFCREDLLARHKSKHNGPVECPDPLGSHGLSNEHDLSTPSRTPPAPYQSEPDPQGVALVPEMSVCEIDPQANQQQPETYTRKGYIPIAELRPPTVGLTVDHARIGIDRQSTWGLDPSPFHSFESGYNTPEQGYQTYGQFQATSTFGAAQSWTTQSSSLYASHSPASRDSTTPTPFGRRPSLVCTQLRTPSSDMSHCDTGNAPFFSDPYVGASEVDFTMLPEYRDMFEQDELVTPTSVPQAANFGPNQYHHRVDNEQRYLEAFWRSVHPSWPILHKSTLDSVRAPPLLRAAMVTLGAHSTGHPTDSGNACILHKRCLKVIRKRMVDQWQSYRVDDMQAIFLVELFAITRSRRPPLQLSKSFVDAYHYLAQAYDTDTDTANAMLTTFDPFDSLHVTPAATCTLGAESTQRLLIACYILDTQNSRFFGREATPIPDFDPATLRLPQPLHRWDITPQLQTAYYTETHHEHFLPQPSLPQAALSASPSNPPSDIFTSTLLITYAHTNTTSKPQDLPLNPSTISSSSSYQTTLTTDLHALTTKTPIRALLAVAGESWIQAEKLGSRAEYARAQAEVRQWATMETTTTGTTTTAGTVDISAAVSIAVEILKLHNSGQRARTGWVFHEWSLHVAVLVLWAGGYDGRRRRRVGGLCGGGGGDSSTSSSEAVGMSVDELDGFLARFSADSAAGVGSISWHDTKALLMWAKARLEKGGTAKFCGVVSGAVNVLAVLVERGDEEGWF